MKNNLKEKDILKLYEFMNFDHPKFNINVPFIDICNSKILSTGNNKNIKIVKKKEYTKNYDKNNNKILVF